MSKPKPLIIIPARVGSVRVKRKNFRRLPDGTTLIDRAVVDARKLNGQIVVTTDHKTWTAEGVTVIRRAKHLATATATSADVVRDVLRRIPGFDTQRVLLLQPTTPYRDMAAIRRALRSKASTVLAFRAKAMTTWGEIEAVSAISGEAYATTRLQAYDWENQCWQMALSSQCPLFNIDTPAQWKALCRHVRLEMRAKR